MSLRSLLHRAGVAALLGLAPQLVSAQSSGPGLPSTVVNAELFGRDDGGALFDTPYQSIAQTFLPLVTLSNTSSFLQSFTVYLQAVDFATPAPRFNAAVWSINQGNPLVLTTALRTTSGPTGSTDPLGWKAVTFDFTNLQLTKNVVYAFVLGFTGYTAQPLVDPAANYVAMTTGTGGGAAFGAFNGATPADRTTSWTPLNGSLAYTATFTATVVPEPSTVLLVGAGMTVLLMLVRRRTV